jgi:hypothetical protein
MRRKKVEGSQSSLSGRRRRGSEAGDGSKYKIAGVSLVTVHGEREREKEREREREREREKRLRSHVDDACNGKD